jgi:hypothetical protein
VKLLVGEVEQMASYKDIYIRLSISNTVLRRLPPTMIS